MNRKKEQLTLKANQLVPFTYLILLAAAFILIPCGFLFSSINLHTKDQNYHELPAKVVQIDEDTKVFTLTPQAGDGNCIMFYSSHTYLHAYSGEHLIYSLEDSGSIFGSTPGGNYHFLNLNDFFGEITLTAEAVYPPNPRL